MPARKDTYKNTVVVIANPAITLKTYKYLSNENVLNTYQNILCDVCIYSVYTHSRALQNLCWIRAALNGGGDGVGDSDCYPCKYTPSPPKNII